MINAIVVAVFRVVFPFSSLFRSFFFVLITSCWCGTTVGLATERGGWLVLLTAAIDFIGTGVSAMVEIVC